MGCIPTEWALDTSSACLVVNIFKRCQNEPCKSLRCSRGKGFLTGEDLSLLGESKFSSSKTHRYCMVLQSLTPTGKMVERLENRQNGGFKTIKCLI